MKNTLLATALFLGGAVFGAHIYRASADTPPGAPPPPGQNMPPPPGPWGMDHHGPFPGGPFPGGMMDRDHDDAFALFARVENKNLSPADVKLIAEATLLEHGNHSWSVTGVSRSGTDIDFSYATPHGDVIATFSVDPASGHMHRVS